MNEEKPRVLRDVKLLWYGPDLTGLGKILSVTRLAEPPARREDDPEDGGEDRKDFSSSI